MEHDEDDREEGPRSFARFFEQLAGGDAHAEASHELFQLGKALSDHAYNVGGKARGKITITLDFEHDDSNVVQESFLDAVKGACNLASSATGLPLYYGTPEV